MGSRGNYLRNKWKNRGLPSLGRILEILEEYKDVIKMHVQNNMTMKSFHEAKNKKLNSIDSVMNKIYICITV